MSSLERQVKEEKYQAGVFQHSLQDRAAELHLERASRQVSLLPAPQTTRSSEDGLSSILSKDNILFFVYWFIGVLRCPCPLRFRDCRGRCFTCLLGIETDTNSQ